MKWVKKLLITSIFILALTICLIPFTKKTNNVSAAIPSGYTLDTAYDLISLSDLTFNGLTNQDVIKVNQNTEASFENSNVNGSLVFKFKYDVVNDSNTDSIAFRIHFDVADDKWNSDCALWVRGDGAYLSTYNNPNFGWSKTSALSKGMHEIEFGRMCLYSNGERTNQYYIYYKVDGVEKDSKVNPYDISKINGSMFINISEGNTMNKIYDINHINGPYESPDRISIKDLLIDGAPFGGSFKMDSHQKFSYSSTSDHNSVVFDFYYDVKSLTDIDCQFHFTDGWIGSSHGGIVWLRNDKNRISKVGGGYVEANPFTKLGLYKVEICKLYIVSGTNQGKYYMSLSVNGTKVLEYIVDDMPDKAALFTTGTNGDYLYDLNYMPVELNTDLYLYKWDISRSGIEFKGTLRKDIADIQGVSEVGFVICPQDDLSNTTILEGKIVESGSNYIVKAAVTALELENITRNYCAKIYYVMPNSLGANKTYYTEYITTSFYKELEDLSSLSSENRAILEEIKNNVLNVTIDEDDCAVVGATKTGDFTTSSLTLTGPNTSYTSFVLNGDLLKENDDIKIGYIYYKVSLGTNSMTLTKQTKKMIYGGSEHFVEINSGHDDNMTARNLSPMATELGLKTIRLDIDFSDLFSVSSNNELTIKNSYVQKVQDVIDELKTNGGITDFLAVFWVVQPYGFKTWDNKPWGSKTAPDPSTQSDMYLKWLRLNGEAARIASSIFPDIHSFETWNEAEMMCEADGPLARPDGTNYSVTEKAKILTDLMYYYNKGIKTTNPKNVLTTPSLCCSQQTDNDFDVTSPNFLKAMYDQIVDSTPVTGYQEVDTDPNNYFDVINIHPYLGRGTNTTNWKNFIKQFHTYSENYGDGGTEIWITEFGFAQNRESNAQSKMLTILQYANQIDYLTKFYFYKIHDYTSKIDDDRWGLYNYDGSIKAIGTAVKNYIKD